MSQKYENSVGRGVVKILTGCIFYFLVPVIYFHYLLPVVPEGMDVAEISALMERWFIGGVPLVAVGFAVAYFAKGNSKRIWACLVHAVLAVAWLLYVTNFGDLSDIFVNEDPAITVSATVLGLILIAAVLKVLKLVVVLADHRDYRDDFAKVSGRDGRGPDAEPIRVQGKYD